MQLVIFIIFSFTSQHMLFRIAWEDFITDDANEQEIMLAIMARSQEEYINSFSKPHVNSPKASSSKEFLPVFSSDKSSNAKCESTCRKIQSESSRDKLGQKQ